MEAIRAEALPQYQCHKRVRAARIDQIFLSVEDQNAMFVLGLPDGSTPIYRVDPPFMVRNDPKIGGYLVIYVGGYESFSPAM